MSDLDAAIRIATLHSKISNCCGGSEGGVGGGVGGGGGGGGGGDGGGGCGSVCNLAHGDIKLRQHRLNGLHSRVKHERNTGKSRQRGLRAPRF